MLNEENPDIENLMCSICLSILVEPVLLPCRHGFCLACFNDNLLFNSPICPYCRKRFGSWLRKATKDNCLVDKELWNNIKKNYKQQLKLKSGNFKLTSKLSDGTSAVTAEVNLSKPGEIHKEYEEASKKFFAEVEKQKENELNATIGYIIKEFGEAQVNSKHEIKQKDNKMLVANAGHTPYALSKTTCATNNNNLSLLQASTSSGPPIASTSKGFPSSSVISVPSSSTSTSTTVSRPTTQTKCSLMKSFSIKLNNGKEYIHKTLLSKIGGPFSSGSKLYTVPPTSIHRSPTRSTDSTDSLRSEMGHFKPIRSVPLTRNPRTEKVIITTPKIRKLIENTDKNKLIVSPKACSIPENLASPSKNSAFCCLISPVKLNQSELSTSPVSSQTPTTTRSTKRSKMTKKNKTKTRSRNVIDASKSSEQSRAENDKSNLTTENGVRRSKRIRNSYESSILNDLKIPDATILTRVIDEQRKREDMLRQELKDYKLAKKLQAELERNSSLSPRKTRRRKADCGQLNKTESGVIPPTKRPRRTSQKSQSLKSSMIIIESDEEIRPTLRRTTRRTKKTR